ncbi:MAG: hypothetical protein ACI91T_000424 [Natronomonas sp.]|jgi:hypothetical protein
MRRAVVLIALLSLSVVAGAVIATDAGGPERASGPTIAQSEEFDRTRFTIRVYRNGSARWTFRYMRLLPDDESVTEFREYADRFESEETQLYRDFEERTRTLTRIGRNRTGREMAAEAFSRRAYVDRGVNDVGVVEMSFRWVAFARVEEPRVVIGDVFEGGLFLGPDQSLVIQPGPDLVFESLAPNGTLSGETLAESDSMTWQGERGFADERPRVVFVLESTVDGTPTAGSPTATDRGGTTDDGPGTSGTTSMAGPTTPGPGPGTSPGTGTGTSTAADGGDGLPSSIVMLIGALVVFLGLVGVIAYRRTDLGSGGGAAGAADTVTSDGSADAGDAGAAVPESAVLSDEERVIELLKENGGRMRQVNIVEETDWSKSKVSMLLSDMEDDGTVSKLRVGRENIVSLSGHEPDAAGSPFEEPDENGAADEEE